MSALLLEKHDDGELYVKGDFYLVVNTKLKRNPGTPVPIINKHGNPQLAWSPQSVFGSKPDAIAVARQLAEKTRGAVYVVVGALHGVVYCTACDKPHEAKLGHGEKPNLHGVN